MDKIWDLQLKFEVRKGKPIEIKLEWKLHYNPEEYEPSCMVGWLSMETKFLLLRI